MPLNWICGTQQTCQAAGKEPARAVGVQQSGGQRQRQRRRTAVSATHTVFGYGTTVVLLVEYHGDLGGMTRRNYGEAMAIVLMMVVLAFGLLYVAVVAEERQMQEATKPRKR